MNETASTCPKCSGEMVDGFVIDNSHGAVLVSQWVKGAPKAATLFGRIVSQLIVKSPKKGETIPIGTFRCQDCGFLESYAREEFGAT